MRYGLTRSNTKHIGAKHIGTKRDFFVVLMSGLFCGTMVARALAALRFESFSGPVAPWLCILFLAALCVAGWATKRRYLFHAVWIGGALVFLLSIAVGYTSLMQPLMKSLVVRDALRRGDAIVVLSYDVWSDGRPVPGSQRRLNFSYQLLRQNLASTLVITRLPSPHPSYQPAVKAQLKKLRLQKVQLLEIGPIHITHDEAVQTARLARNRGWNRILVVTDGFHSHRARALFRALGVNATVHPCSDPLRDFGGLQTPEQRYAAFRIWRYETVALCHHKLHGWL